MAFRFAGRRALALAASSGLAAAVALPVCSSERAERFADLKFKRSFQGQLAPAAPRAEELNVRSTANGAVAACDGVTLQRGPYESLWLRVGLATPMPTVRALMDRIEEALAEAASVPAAVYVTLAETSVDAEHIRAIRARGFSFHHFIEASSPGAPNELVYYAWPKGDAHDMVPAYATSIEGICALLLSPDEQRVLLVWEWGGWKCPTGAVDCGESKLGALARECWEETGVRVDNSFAPVYLGGWHCSKARDRAINDNFSAFAVRASSEEVQVDGREIVAARWFDRKELMRMYREMGRPQGQRNVELPLDDAHGRRKVNRHLLCYLETYEAGRGLRCAVKERPEIGEGATMLELGV